MVGKVAGDQRVHNPMGERAQTLPFRPHPRRKDFAQIDPDDRSLRKRKECDIGHQQPQ